MNEIGFFAEALKLVDGNNGIIVIVAMFVFSGIVTLILSKVIQVNQKQSFKLLLLIFIGVFVIVFYAMVLNQANEISKGNITIVQDNNKTDIKVKNSTQNNTNNIINNKDSKVNIVNN